MSVNAETIAPHDLPCGCRISPTGDRLCQYHEGYEDGQYGSTREASFVLLRRFREATAALFCADPTPDDVDRAEAVRLEVDDYLSQHDAPPANPFDEHTQLWNDEIGASDIDGQDTPVSDAGTMDP